MSTQARNAVRPVARAEGPAPRPLAVGVRPVRLLAYVLGVALLVAASVGTVASQSDRFVGVHELPPFVCDRVELVAGHPERVAPEEVPSPRNSGPVCPRGSA
jgi:hypothetical protein